MVGSFIQVLDNALFTLIWPWPILIICFGMAVIAVLAYVLKHLTFSGCCAAFILGVSVLWITRFEGFFLFLLFYVACNLSGRITKKASTSSSCRSWSQVLANGLVPLMMAWCSYFSYNNKYIIAFASAIAEAISDTWAGDFGRLWPYKPLSLRDFRPAERGMSGAVSPLGCIAGLGGAGLIAFAFGLFFSTSDGWQVIIICGFFGCLLDSVLGAFCQALYRTDDGLLTEEPAEYLVHGLRWIDNDVVNFISNLSAAMLALLIG